MTSITALRSVLEHVEALKGPLTRGEAEMLADKLFQPGSVDRMLWRDVVAALGGGREALGAVVALVKREMPSAEWKVKLVRTTDEYMGWVTGVKLMTYACDPAVALLAAYLRARIAEAEQAGQRAGKAS